MIQYDVLKNLVKIKINSLQTFLHELADLFSKQTTERFNLLEDTIRQSYRKPVSRLAHTLKGSCCYFGLLKESFENVMSELQNNLGIVVH